MQIFSYIFVFIMHVLLKYEIHMGYNILSIKKHKYTSTDTTCI